MLVDTHNFEFDCNFTAFLGVEACMGEVNFPNLPEAEAYVEIVYRNIHAGDLDTYLDQFASSVSFESQGTTLEAGLNSLSVSLHRDGAYQVEGQYYISNQG